jgi:hypothetical protein
MVHIQLRCSGLQSCVSPGISAFRHVAQLQNPGLFQLSSAPRKTALKGRIRSIAADKYPKTARSSPGSLKKSSGKDKDDG